jgi:hypothetical protein
MRRAAHLNPLSYSFLAGILTSLACNVYTTAALNFDPGFPRWQVYSSAAAFVACGALVFMLSTHLQELRGIQATMGSPPNPHDLDLLLRDPRHSRRLVRILAGAGVFFVVAVLLLGMLSIKPASVSDAPLTPTNVEPRLNQIPSGNVPKLHPPTGGEALPNGQASHGEQPLEGRTPDPKPESKVENLDDRPAAESAPKAKQKRKEKRQKRIESEKPKLATPLPGLIDE